MPLGNLFISQNSNIGHTQYGVIYSYKMFSLQNQTTFQNKISIVTQTLKKKSDTLLVT